MNVDRTKFIIPMVCGDLRYQIIVQVENPIIRPVYWWACDSNYSNPQESPTGWGLTPEKAIQNFIENVMVINLSKP